MSWLRKRITIHVAFAFNGAISFEWLLLLVVGSARVVPAMVRLPACACLCVSHVKAGFSPLQLQTAHDAMARYLNMTGPLIKEC
jgi:hypothetical protein